MRYTRDSILLCKCIKFRNKLEEKAKSKKASIQGPGWPSGHIRDIRCITITAKEDYPLAYRLLTRIGFGIKILNCWLRDAIEEAETMLRYQRLRESATKNAIHTAHDPSPLLA